MKFQVQVIWLPSLVLSVYEAHIIITPRFAYRYGYVPIIEVPQRTFHTNIS